MKQVIRKNVAEHNNINNAKTLYTLVVDGTNLLKMAMVNNTLVNNNGECYGGVVNFLRMLGDILRKKDFNHCHLCWDSKESGILRYSIYKDYKANRDKHYENYENDYNANMAEYAKMVIAYSRSKQKAKTFIETEEESFERQKIIIQQILEELFVRQHEYEKVEGDDLIAYYLQNRQENEKTVIVSSDNDLSQLISENVCIWNPRKKKFITSNNSVEELGITHENIVLLKIFCGDTSDNISGIKGMGEKSFLKYFPEMIQNKGTVESVVERSQALLSERKEQKKKPLKVLENVLNRVTDGSQGKDIYEINKKIIDLSEPLLTDEAKKDFNEEIGLPLDVDSRNLNNIYDIINENNMVYLQDEFNFGKIFGAYNRIMTMEKNYSKENS